MIEWVRACPERSQLSLVAERSQFMLVEYTQEVPEPKVSLGQMTKLN